MTTNSKDNSLKMRRRLISLTLVAFLALSLSLSIATAKPISHTNNNNYFNHALKSNKHSQQQAHNGGGLLKRISSSWTSLTTPLQGLYVISGSPGPAANINSGSVKRLHKRGGVDSGINYKKPTTVKSSEGKNAQKKKTDKATARAKHTYSAYEAIVNSDSQMPVFLNQFPPKSTTKSSGNGKGKGKSMSAATLVAAGAGGEGKKKKVGTVKPIDILRQTGSKKPTAATAATIGSPSTALPIIEDEQEEKKRKVKSKAEMDDTSPTKKNEARTEGMAPTLDPLHPNKKNINNTNKVSPASRAIVAAAVEDETSAVKTLFDTVFSQDLQQPSRRAVEPAPGATGAGTADEKKGKDSEEIKAIKETINTAAHVAVAAAAVAGNSHHSTFPNSHHLEERDTAGILKQALENIAHKIEEAATAAIALEIPSLTDHTLGSHSATALHEMEAPLQDDKKSEPALKNHKDTIIDDEGAVDLPAFTNNNNHHDNTAPTNDQESGSTVATKQKPEPIVINDSEYTSFSSEDEDDPYAYTYPPLQNPVPSTEYSDNNDEWRLSDDHDIMAQYVHRRPDNFPGSESILFTGTVLRRTLACSFLLLSGFLVLSGFISYKMYARRRNTSPWAFLHHMTFGIFTSLFYDSTSMSNSTLNSYITTADNQSSPSTASSSTLKKGYGFGAGGNATWLRRGSLIHSSTTTKGNYNIMSSPAEKEPLLPESVVASSASSSFKKSGPNGTKLRRTSTAQHHQMQIGLALQQQQRQEKEQQQQAEMDYLQKSFIRRTSI